MDFAVLVGLFIGFGSIITSVFLEHGRITAYVNLAALVIIIGGTLSATTISTSIKDILNLPKLLKVLFSNKINRYKDIIDEMTKIALSIRKNGYLSVDDKVKEINDPIFKKGLQLIADGVDSSDISEIINSEINAMEKRHKKGIEIFSMMGGYAPTMGIIGTVLGLVNMLMSFGTSEGESLGKSVAVAFIATLYGIFFANLIFLPISSNLKAKSTQEIIGKELILEGLLAVHAGLSPKMVEEKMKSFLGTVKTK